MRISIPCIVIMLLVSSCDLIQSYQEAHKPLEYLSIINGTYKPNLIERHFFGADDYDGYIMEGDVHNDAFKVGFNNIIIAVKYFNASGRLIKTDNYDLKLHVSPNSSKHFVRKFYPPGGMANLELSIVNAKGG